MEGEGEKEGEGEGEEEGEGEAEEKSSPMFVPTKGVFFQHDDRYVSGEENEQEKRSAEYAQPEYCQQTSVYVPMYFCASASNLHLQYSFKQEHNRTLPVPPGWCLSANVLCIPWSLCDGSVCSSDASVLPAASVWQACWLTGELATELCYADLSFVCEHQTGSGSIQDSTA